MSTLNLLIVILAILIAIDILKVILKAIPPSKLKTFKIKDDNHYIVNVKSIKKAIEVADYNSIFISEEDLEEVNINIPKRWESQIMSEKALIEIANIDLSKKSEDKCHTEDEQ